MERHGHEVGHVAEFPLLYLIQHEGDLYVGLFVVSVRVNVKSPIPRTLKTCSVPSFFCITGTKTKWWCSRYSTRLGNGMKKLIESHHQPYQIYHALPPTVPSTPPEIVMPGATPWQDDQTILRSTVSTLTSGEAGIEWLQCEGSKQGMISPRARCCGQDLRIWGDTLLGWNSKPAP